MKLTSLGFDLKKSSIRKSIKVQSQLKQSNTSIPSQLAVPSSKLLQTYNVVSFKGELSQGFDFSALAEKPNYQAYKTMLPIFGSFQNGVMRNQKFADLFDGYTVDEIVTLFDEVIENQQEYNFSKLVNAGKNIPKLPRNLSFKEAKDLTLNGIIEPSDIEGYLKMVDEDDLDPNIALASIRYKISPKDRIKLEELLQQLYNGNRKLSKEEAVTCLAYGFHEAEQVQSFINRLEKDYKGNKLDLFEAALCTVHNIDDATTERFFELKSMQLPYIKEDWSNAIYTLSSQEAILCAKAELDDDELKQYAELKNKPIMYTAVRDNNSEKSLSIELLISYIKDKQIDEKIGALGRYSFQNETQYQDYKQILRFFGYALLYHIQPYSTQDYLTYIAKLQDENGKNIFKDEDGNFNFGNFGLGSLRKIAYYGLTKSQIDDYSRLLVELTSLPNIDDEDVESIAVRLARLQGENKQNLFKNSDGTFDFKNFDLNSLRSISLSKLTKKQIDDYSEILSILTKEQISHYSLAVNLARMPDKVKDTYRDSEGKLNFNDYDLTSIREIAYRKFTKEQVAKFFEILSWLNTLPNENKYPVDYIAETLIKLPQEISDTYKDEQGNVDFSKFDIDSLYEISKSHLTLSQANDYVDIRAILKRKTPQKDCNVSYISRYIAKFSEEVKKEFKDDKNQFNFDNYDLKTLLEIGENDLTTSEIRDLNQILSILRTMYDNSEFELPKVAISVLRLKDENGENIFRNKNGQFNFGNFDLYALSSIGSFKLNSSQISDFSKIRRIIFSPYFSFDKSASVAAFLAKLSDEEKENLKNENGDFDLKKIMLIPLDRCMYYRLSPQEYKDFSSIYSRLRYLPVGDSYASDDDCDDYDDTMILLLAKDLLRCRDKSGKNIFIDESGVLRFGYLDLCSLHLAARYSEQECENYRYLTSTLGVSPENAIFIAIDDELMERFKLVDPNIFWEGATGETKETFELFDSVLCSDNIFRNRLKESDFDTELPKDYSFKFGTLRYYPSSSTKQGFNVDLQKASKNSSSIMIVKNKDGEKESYIAYDGAIALLRELRTLTKDEEGILKEDLSSHSHFSTEEINALSEASRHFIVNIIQENGECIISKGIDGISSPFDGKKIDTETTKEKFKEVLQKLHNDSSSPNITIENILRLIPKDATIQIRPYTTKSKSTHEMLYSISAEWKDSNGKNWQMRVHSQDLKFINNGKAWIYRVGYQDENSAEPLFYDNNQNDFIIGLSNPSSHVSIDEEPENYQNKLISNPYFQNIIRDISISFNKTQMIDNVASELNIHTSDKKQKKDEIIAKCQQDAGFYYKYKEIVDTLLKEKGFLPFSSVS